MRTLIAFGLSAAALLSSPPAPQRLLNGLWDATVTVNDVDSTNLASATIHITTNYVNGQDVLSFTNANGITGSFTAATGTMTLSGTPE